MAVTSSFLDAHRLWQRIPGCPQAVPSAAPDMRACRACRLNLAAPGQAQTGCLVRTPDDVIDRGAAELQARNETLHQTLTQLLTVPPENSP